jgi:hypothetical protein
MTVSLALLAIALLALGIGHLGLRPKARMPHPAGSSEAITRQAYAGLAGHSYANAGLLLLVAVTFNLATRSDLTALVTLYLVFAAGIYGTVLNYRALQLILLIDRKLRNKEGATAFSDNHQVRTGIVIAFLAQPAATFLTALHI